jgi:predicted PurR-regulated permease PerM
VQQLESNVITPMVERRMVTIPPVLLLLAVTEFGLLFGIVGVIIAAPLTVVLYVAVQKLYIEHTLGQTSSVPGES